MLLLVPTPSLAQGCGIGLAVQPTTVNLPSGALPNGTITFGEILNVNYSSAFVNETLYVEYWNGTGWKGLSSFTGNSVGFTEVDEGLNPSWAHFGDNAVHVVGGSCESNPATFAVRDDAYAIPLDVLVYVGIAAALFAFFFLGRKLGVWRYALVAGGAYLLLAPFTGQRYDVYFLISSGVRVILHVNPFDPGNPQLYPGALKWAYPPLYAAYSAFSFFVYHLLTGTPIPSAASLVYPGWLTSTYSIWQAFIPPALPVLVLLLKLPMIVAAVWTGLLLSRMTGTDSSVVFWLANPLVLLVASVWGQLDPIATLLALVAVYFHQRGKDYHAYLFASFGAAVKVWPVLLIPLFLVVGLRKRGRGALKPLIATLPAALVTAGLYAAFGGLVESLFVLVYARGIPTFAGAFSVNGLTWQQILALLGAPPVPLFLYVGVPAYAAILAWMYVRRDYDVVKWVIISILILFLTYNYVNPQYFYWILPFLMLQRRKIAYAAFTALPLIFMTFAYNVFYFVSPALLPSEFAIGPSIVEQFKVNYFYQTPVAFALISGLVPTGVYLYYLLKELRQERSLPTVPSVSV